MAESDAATVSAMGSSIDPYAIPGALVPAGAEPIVRLDGIEKYFGSNHVLRGCNLEVYPKETICLIGRSGSGKSTLLRCTNFLEEPTVGSVEVDGLRIEADPLHAAAGRTASRSARSGCAPRWSSRSSTCSRT